MRRLIFVIVSTLIFGIECRFRLPETSKDIFHIVKNANGSFSTVVTKESHVGLELKEDGVAVGYHERKINETGWSFLEIKTNGSFPDEDQAYWAGYLEGVLTYDVIYMHWFNTLGDFCEDRENLCEKLDQFIERNLKWVASKSDHLAATDEYWHHVSLYFRQVQGLAHGYQAANKDDTKALTLKDILWLNLQGDFDDLMEVLQAKSHKFVKDDYLPLSAKGLGHCSALIKVLPDKSDLLVAQVTWSTDPSKNNFLIIIKCPIELIALDNKTHFVNRYQSMLRIQKKYTLNFHKTLLKSEVVIPGREMSFSSYPGVTTSGDDFYLISSGLATLETTIGNGNVSLWQFVKPTGQVFEGVRSMVANRLAINGRSWTKIFARYNSGTYNNQWMIVDYNKFELAKRTPNRELPDETLWVLEQIPNYIHADDMTDVLRRNSYWPSYNTAAFPWIFNMSGNQAMVKKFGDWFTYEKNPRALIFKRDHASVRDLQSMYQLMRYNDYKNDPLSACSCTPPYSAENAISARCDLNPANGSYPFPALGHRQHGATDAKITSSDLFSGGLSFLAVSGPTYNETVGIPPFEWSKSDYEATTPHLGHPNKWTFRPVIKQWA